ncbi:MAG TPA: hypothetical protein PKH92_14405, partial [Anaerolineaceae bacterium]|nr:hypothetical protein [Anaerolineaceae bacterium]
RWRLRLISLTANGNRTRTYHQQENNGKEMYMISFHQIALQDISRHFTIKCLKSCFRQIAPPEA